MTWIAHQLPSALPPLAPLDGAGLIVMPVLNVESWPFDRPMPRKLLTGPHGRDDVPDVPNYSWVEYGLRAGVERLVTGFAERGLPVGLSVNAAIAEDYPAVFALLRETGWEFIAHGVRQESVTGAADEREVITASLRMLTESTGRRPRGWMGPGLAETMRTPAILAELGVEYVLDWALADYPLWMNTDPPVLALPYNLELNDSVVVAVERQPMPEYERRVRETVAVLRDESARGARVLALPMHPHLLGVPHRVRGLLALVDELVADPAVTFASPGTVVDWYRGQVAS
jgi:allantoinase